MRGRNEKTAADTGRPRIREISLLIGYSSYPANKT